MFKRESLSLKFVGVVSKLSLGGFKICLTGVISLIQKNNPSEVDNYMILKKKYCF